jgi:hypothetical protein
MHARISRLPGSRPLDLAGRAGGLTGLVYHTIRGVTRVVGGSIDALLGLIAPALDPQQPREREVSPEREGLVAALNGVLGDYLAATGNPLAIKMAFRTIRATGQGAQRRNYRPSSRQYRRRGLGRPRPVRSWCGPPAASGAAAAGPLPRAGRVPRQARRSEEPIAGRWTSAASQRPRPARESRASVGHSEGSAVGRLPDEPSRVAEPPGCLRPAASFACEGLRESVNREGCQNASEDYSQFFLLLAASGDSAAA